jgi:hypothetical protein
MRRRRGFEIVGDHVRDEDEKLERRDADRSALGVRPDLSSAKLLARNVLAPTPTTSPTPSPLDEAKKGVADLYRKYRPNYSDHVLSLRTKI